MLTTLGIVALLIVLVYVFFSLLIRALRLRRPVGKLVGALVSAALTVAFAAAAVVALVGVWRVETPRNAPVPEMAAAATPEALARGAQLAGRCVDCHTPDGQLPLSGGRRNLLPARPLMGAVYGTNLTPAGPLAGWRDGAIARAIREGLDNRGVPLMTMPGHAFRDLSDADVSALVAYLRSQPALRNDQPPNGLGFLGFFLAGLGRDPAAAAVTW